MTEAENIKALKALSEKVNKDRQERGGLMKVTSGAFGDISNREDSGLVEEIIFQKDGQVFTKFYGCSIPFRGNPTFKTTLNIGMGKAMISGMLREILFQSHLLQLSLILMYLFARKRFYHYLWVYSSLIRKNSLATVPKNQYGIPIRELKRAMNVALGNELKKGGSNLSVSKLLNEDYHLEKGNVCRIIANIAEFVYYFLEYDSAYRWPLQDILENVNKDLAKERILAETNRLFSLLIERTTNPQGDVSQLRKWVYMKRAVLVGLFLFPTFRRILRDFLVELDVEKVGLDDDWYFCLRRQFYNYRGIPLAERIKEKERIDREKGHILIEFNRVET